MTFDVAQYQESPGYDGDPGALALIEEDDGRAHRRASRKADPVYEWFAEFRHELAKQHDGRIVYCRGVLDRGDPWLTSTGLPVGHLHHHTAAAVTASRDRRHKGNKPGANSGIVAFCINQHGGKGLPNTHGFCNQVNDRDGSIFIVGAHAQWHAGLGDFTGTRWARLGIRKDMGNRALWGTENVSKGLSEDFTAAQLEANAATDVALRITLGWRTFPVRLMNHKDWTTRKIDTRYPALMWADLAVDAWQDR
ncbi:MAG: hypothetical protein Q8M17_10495 [Actinomycetota bacterium]|nr:hypothetical protein [Actinomycetota bacterium]